MRIQLLLHLDVHALHAEPDDVVISVDVHTRIDKANATGQPVFRRYSMSISEFQAQHG